MGFLIKPNVLTRYEADQENPWTYVWVGFSGEKCEQFLRDIGIDAHTLLFQTENGEELKYLVLDMLKSQTISTADEFRLQGLLYLFFSTIAKNNTPIENKSISNDNDYVQKVCDFIQLHYHQPIKVQDIATYVNLNRSYLSSIFQQSTGMTIQEYLTKFRMTRASELLKITNLTVEQIAESCGYKDALVFSKAFKKTMDMTPTAYRKTQT